MIAPEWGMRAKVRAHKQKLEAGVYAAVFCVYWPAAEHGPTELETCWKKNCLPTMSHKEPPHVRRWLKSFCSSLLSGAGRHEEGEDVLKFIPSM